MNKIEITIEGPKAEVKINGIKQDNVKFIKLDALILEGVVINCKSLIFPTNGPELKQDPPKETDDQTINRA